MPVTHEVASSSLVVPAIKRSHLVWLFLMAELIVARSVFASSGKTRASSFPPFKKTPYGVFFSLFTPRLSLRSRLSWISSTLTEFRLCDLRRFRSICSLSGLTRFARVVRTEIRSSFPPLTKFENKFCQYSNADRFY